MTQGGPVQSLDFRRIEALPRRDWTTADDLEDLTDGLTELLRTPNGTMRLKPIQAAALREIHDHQCLFGPIAVGGGKALISLLAPVVLAAKRPVLLIPASVRDQTLHSVLPEMGKHWKLNPALRVVAYSDLSLAKNADLLEQLQPDMLILDEAHLAKHISSGRTKRINRYMRAYPHTVVIAMSGTIANHSILHYWHTIQWALKPDNIPLPKTYREAAEWGNALDERVKEPSPPGALLRLCEAGENARQGYRRRLTETPGVIATHERDLGVGLQLHAIRDIAVPRSVQAMLDAVEHTWETPDGEVIMEASRYAAIRRQILTGFRYRLNPLPPKEWAEARKAWHQYVRVTLQSNRRRLDTPLQVWNDAAKKRKPPWEWTQWKAVKDKFKPNKEVVWIDDYLVRIAAEWLHRGDGICWVAHQAMGSAISKMAGVPLFGAGDSHIRTASGPIVASVAAHGVSKNLQQWDRNLVVEPMVSGEAWEQLMGRNHRTGQLSDTVTCEVLLHHLIFQKAMDQAFADAVFLQDTMGNRQRLLYCDTDILHERSS